MAGCVHCLVFFGFFFPWHREEFCRTQLPARLAVAQLAPGRHLRPSQRLLRLWRSSGSFWCISDMPRLWHLVLSFLGRTPQCCESKEFLCGDSSSCACSHLLCAQPTRDEAVDSFPGLAAQLCRILHAQQGPMCSFLTQNQLLGNSCCRGGSAGLTWLWVQAGEHRE